MNEQENRFNNEPVLSAEAAPDTGRGAAGPSTYAGDTPPGPAPDFRAAGASAPPPPYAGAGPGTAYGAPPPGVYNVPAPAGLPNPATAFVLGFLPGVGAMYNGQFAKGIANIAIFAVLVSFADHISGVFGIFIAGWIAFMVFDAYQTARARRFGLPIPNAFGLNDLGERFGFGPNAGWQGPAPSNGGPSTAAPPAGYRIDPQGTVYPAAPPSAPAPPYPADPYTGPAAYSSQQPPPPYSYAAASSSAPPAPAGYPYVHDPRAGAATYAYAPYAPPPMPDWTMPPPPPLNSTYTDPASVRPATGLASVPTGALWLIGLGLLALLGSVRGFRYVNGEFTAAFLLIAFGAFLLVRKWQQMDGLSVEGSAQRRWLLINNMRGPALFLIAGLLTLLQAVRLLNWGQSWPFLLIFIGVWILIERLSFNRVAEENFAFAAGPVPVTPPASGSQRGFAPSVVPSGDESTTDKEGR